MKYVRFVTVLLLMLWSLTLAHINLAHAATIVTNPGDVPSSISIPKIGKIAQIIPVGVTATGNLDVPHNFVQAGWYEYGAAPGQAGSAVIDGHVDNGASIVGVFKLLHELTPGDVIDVSNMSGNTLRYEVTATNVYSKDAFPSNQIFADSNQSLLKIITCYGTFLPNEDTYDRRLVVTAALVA